jgi:uncharacterized damage-inducible protein DinB
MEMRKLSIASFAFLIVVATGTTRTFAQSNMQGRQDTQPVSHAGNNSVGFDFKADVLADVKDAEKKFVGLAQAIPADKYTWRPGEGVRSVSEVFLHVATANFGRSGMLGTPAKGIDLHGLEKSTTDKNKIVDQLNRSFAHIELAISNSDVQKHTKVLGRDTTGGDVLFLMVTHLHEHLGQMIAYARINGVVPPWTSEQSR